MQAKTNDTTTTRGREAEERAARHLESRGLRVFTPEITELAKGGGYIRCTTLTLA